MKLRAWVARAKSLLCSKDGPCSSVDVEILCIISNIEKEIMGDIGENLVQGSY